LPVTIPVSGFVNRFRYCSSSYVFAVWRYRAEHKNTIYVQTFCVFFWGNFDVPHECGGDSNRTFVHLLK
jgi:hypothetical protein